MKHQNAPSPQPFDADQPLEKPEHDRFDRVPFAEGLARRIVSLPKGNCYTIGLHGAWGDGKTTVLRFVEAALARHGKVVCVRYNPWRFANEDAMLAGFFQTLASEMDVKLRTLVESMAPLVTTAARLGDLLVNGIGELVAGVADKSRPSVEVVHDRLREGLLKADSRIVVFVDDIDRLEDHEASTLFRILKACLDLPNVVYVLAFDREQVAAMLGTRVVAGGIDGGRRFLEKIIHIPLPLPPATPTALERVCKQRIEEVLESAGVRLSEKESEEWERAFARCVAVRIRTPRHIQQYLNAVNFAVPMLHGEVHPVDLLLVEALRVFYPGAYELISRRLDEFVAQAPRYAFLWPDGTTAPDDLAPVKQALDLRDAAGLEALVQQLFPMRETSRRGFHATTNQEPVWTRERRVCSPAYAQRYFSYAVGSGDVSDRAITAIIDEANADDAPRLRSLLEAEIDPPTLPILIEKLVQQRESASARGAARLATHLAALSGRFTPPFSLYTLTHPSLRAAHLATVLCGMVPEGEARSAAALSVVRNAGSVWFSGAFMLLIDPPVRPHSFTEMLVPAQLENVRREFSQRVGDFWMSGQSPFDLSSRWKFELLVPWAQTAGRQAVWERFFAGMQIDGGIALRMLRCLKLTAEQAADDTQPFRNLDLNLLKELDLIVDVEDLYKLLTEQWLTPERRRPPGEWPSMKADDRQFAEFWWAYCLRHPEMLASLSPLKGGARSTARPQHHSQGEMMPQRLPKCHIEHERSH